MSTDDASSNINSTIESEIAKVTTSQNANVWYENTDPFIMNGSGTLHLENGNKYEGEFVNGRKIGIKHNILLCINYIFIIN